MSAGPKALWQSRDERLTVVDCDNGIQVSVGLPHDFRSADLEPEQIAHLVHALNKWVARFTSNA